MKSPQSSITHRNFSNHNLEYNSLFSSQRILNDQIRIFSNFLIDIRKIRISDLRYFEWNEYSIETRFQKTFLNNFKEKNIILYT